MYKYNMLVLLSTGIIGIALLSAPAFAADDEFDIVPSETQQEVSLSNKINAKESLSSNLDKQAQNKNGNQPGKKGESENWLKSLINRGTTDFFKNDTPNVVKKEEENTKNSIANQRSNAANFDISGVKLRMNPQEISDILTKQGYRRLMQKMEIPNFIKWRSEELCRIHGVIGFERLNACATKLAQENGYQFIEYEVYNRYATRETIEVYYTSTFTDNLSHRIYYKSGIQFSDSKASKNVYINNLKIYDFWRRIDLKYGEPDNTSEVKWGLGGKKPYLHAETGKLELIDPLLKGMDVARMFNEDTRLANTEYYTF